MTRYDMRLAALALAILVGLMLEVTQSRDLARCDGCAQTYGSEPHKAL